LKPEAAERRHKRVMRKMTKRTTLPLKVTFLGLIVAACFMIIVPPLSAQQGQQGQQGQEGYNPQQQQNRQPAQPPPADFSEDTLENFAEAKIEIDEIRSAYSEELKSVEDPDKARELQDKYTKKMISAVESNDLSINKYNGIIQAMRNNPELLEKVENMTN
jgi:hypothetical protein